MVDILLSYVHFVKLKEIQRWKKNWEKYTSIDDHKNAESCLDPIKDLNFSY